jgi:hypothetical protein
VRKLSIVLAIVLASRVVAAQPQTDADRQPVQVRTSVSQTAVWVGDRVEFVVEFSCVPRADVIADDLAREKLKLDGLEVVATSSERGVAADGRLTHRFRYVLSSYETRSPALRIASWPVRYYLRRAGERPEDSRPAGDVQVPGTVITRRSTLPDQVTTLDLRAARTTGDLPRALRVGRLVGTGLILLSAAPLAIWTAVLIGRWRTRVRRPRAASVRAHARSALEELRALDTTTESSRRDAYRLLDRTVRKHLADTSGLPAHALPSAELAARLAAAGSPHADTAGTLLAECEAARYAPPDRLPAPERFGAALDAAQRMLEGIRV